MWNWNNKKLFVLALVVGFLLVFAGFSTKEAIILGTGILLLVRWFISEINFIRKAHGTEIDELEGKVEELEGKFEKLEKKK